MKKLLLLFASLSLAAGPGGEAARPAYDSPPEALRLAGRDVALDAALPLPEPGGAVYVFTRRALAGPELAALEQAGLRYLGLAAARVYVFMHRADPGARAALAALAAVRGTALPVPEDRLEDPLLLRWRSGAGPLPLGLRVSFHPHTTAGELRALVRRSAERLRLPRDEGGALGAERYLWIPPAEASAELLARLAQAAVVGRISVDWPRVQHNAASRAASNADRIIAPPLALSGEGVVVGHWDGGAVSSRHPDFEGRVVNQENAGVSDHATHTAGTILGAGLSDGDAKGYAPRATMVAYDFYGDPPAERREAKHEHYHQHDNHSWGSDGSSFGGYDGTAEELDLDSRDDFLFPVKSAGNDGQRSEVTDQGYGFDSLSPDSTGKNVLIIGATEDDGPLASFSSRGPTNDGRIKPDLSANGSDLYSTVPGNGYGGMSGTSMSAPSVTGMIALLSQLFSRTYQRRWAPDEIRAIMLHTVTDVFHTGPDYRHGWGNADAAAAAALIQADALAPGRQLARGAVGEGQSVEWQLDLPAGAPELRLTLTWLDSTAQSTAMRRLIHDLDLEVTDPSGQRRYPWTLDPANPFADATRDQPNTRDNIEQVLVDQPPAGRWRVKVVGTSISDPDLRTQGFVLASSHPLARTLERVAAQVPAAGLAVADGNGVSTLDLLVREARPVISLRVYLELRAEERGQVRVALVHPDGTRALLEREDTATRRDLYAIYPDVRPSAEDLRPLIGRPGNGTWKLEVSDVRAGGATSLLGAMLEVEIDGAEPPPNSAPQANAGKDQTVAAGATVSLDGSLSVDADGDPLAFGWMQQAGPAVSLTGADGARPTFTAPANRDDVQLVFTLTVDDGRGGSGQDSVVVTVTGTGMGEPANQPPVARVTAPMVVPPGYAVRLDAAPSTDPDGDALAYRWTQTAGDHVDSRAEGAALLFAAPETQVQLALGFRVEVSDGRGGVDLEDVSLTVMPGAPAPVLERLPPIIRGGCSCRAGEGGGVGVALLLLFGLALRRRR